MIMDLVFLWMQKSIKSKVNLASICEQSQGKNIFKKLEFIIVHTEYEKTWVWIILEMNLNIFVN